MTRVLSDMWADVAPSVCCETLARVMFLSWQSRRVWSLEDAADNLRLDDVDPCLGAASYRQAE